MRWNSWRGNWHEAEGPKQQAKRPGVIFGHQDHFFSLVDSLSAIRMLSRIPLEGITEEQLLGRALDALIEYQDLEQCSIFLPDDGVLSCAVGRGLDTFGRHQAAGSASNGRTMRFTAGEGIMGLALQSGQIQYCRNCKADTRFKPFAGSNLFYGDGSLIAAPIVSDDDVLGVLNVSHHQPEFFQTWHQHFLMLFANFLGRLLHLHRLVNRLEDRIASRTRALAQSLEESEQLRVRYQELSVMDELTGLHNRRHFFAEGAPMLARAARHGHPLGLVLVELDQLKNLNDNRGHQAGDRAILQVAGTLRNQARTGDLLARLGAGEFALLLPHTLVDGVERMAGRIQAAVAEAVLWLEGEPVKLSVSIGMAGWCGSAAERPAEQLDRLYRQADGALTRCKRVGPNRRLFHAPEPEPASEQTPAAGPHPD